VVTGTVRVATVYSVGLHTLPPVIKRCLVDHPRVSVRLSYRRTNEVYAACLDGEVDLGIVALPGRRPQLEIVPLGHDELVVVAPPGHPVIRRARCPLAALDGQPFIGFDRDIPTRRLVDSLLRRHGARVSYAMELDNIETIKRSVEAGLGLSLLPAPTLTGEIRARTLVARPPLEGPFRRPIGVRASCQGPARCSSHSSRPSLGLPAEHGRNVPAQRVCCSTVVAPSVLGTLVPVKGGRPMWRSQSYSSMVAVAAVGVNGLALARTDTLVSDLRITPGVLIAATYGRGAWQVRLR
jgi:LysR substrate binding domain